MCRLKMHILGLVLQSPSILILNIPLALDSMPQVYVSSECTTVGNNSATYCALVRISLRMDDLHMPVSEFGILERLGAQKASTTATRSPDNHRPYTYYRRTIPKASLFPFLDGNVNFPAA